MKGHVRKRGNRWAYVVYEPALGFGHGKHRWYSGFASERAADAALRAKLVEMDKGTYRAPNRKLTLAVWLEQWLKDCDTRNVRRRTVEGYAHIVRRHIIPALGAVQLSKVTSDMIANYYVTRRNARISPSLVVEADANGVPSRMRSDGSWKTLLVQQRRRVNGVTHFDVLTSEISAMTLYKDEANVWRRTMPPLSRRTMNHHHVTLHTALQAAVRRGHIAFNPVANVDAPGFSRPEMRTLAAEEVRVFLEAARDTSYYSIFYTGLHTGLRRSELLPLRWMDLT